MKCKECTHALLLLLTCIRCQMPGNLRFSGDEYGCSRAEAWSTEYLPSRQTLCQITNSGCGSLFKCGEARFACLCPVSKPDHDCDARIGFQPIQQALRLCAAAHDPVQLTCVPLWMLLAAFALACAILRAPHCLPDRESILIT